MRLKLANRKHLVQVLGNSYVLLWYYLCLVLAWEREGMVEEMGNTTMFRTDTAVLILSKYHSHGLDARVCDSAGLKQTGSFRFPRISEGLGQHVTFAGQFLIFLEGPFGLRCGCVCTHSKASSFFCLNNFLSRSDYSPPNTHLYNIERTCAEIKGLEFTAKSNTRIWL